MPRRAPIEVPRTIVDEYHQGASPSELAGKHSVSPQTIVNRLREYGATMRPPGRVPGDPRNVGGSERKGLREPRRP